MTSRLDRRTFLATTLAGGAALVARPALAATDPMSKEAVLHDPEAPVLGNPKGDVTIVEWFDYQCPYCKKAYPEILKIVADDGGIRLVMKDWPIFGPPSERATRLTLAAGKFRPRALDALMRADGRLTDPVIEARLKASGFDVDALQRAYRRDRKRIDALVARNSAQAEAFGFPGTPAYLVGTVVFPGVLTVQDFQQAIRDARAKNG